MRADRLLSILLLLQANGRMCAADLAEKLEVSRRTVYRDLDALLAFGGQGPAADLGFESQLEGASRKLAVAARPDRAGRLRERVLIDGERWFRTAPVPAHLTRVQDALWLDRRVRLRYRRTLDRVVDRVIEPYGLVCKAGTWYLLAGVRGEPRVYRVSRIEDAEMSAEQFARRAGFRSEEHTS